MDTVERKPPLPLGTKTEWGEIEAIGSLSGERYYWMAHEDGGVAMIPAFIVEAQHEAG